MLLLGVGKQHSHEVLHLQLSSIQYRRFHAMS
jgi:hypothetical protein